MQKEHQWLFSVWVKLNLLVRVVGCSPWSRLPSDLNSKTRTLKSLPWWSTLEQEIITLMTNSWASCDDPQEVTMPYASESITFMSETFWSTLLMKVQNLDRNISSFTRKNCLVHRTKAARTIQILSSESIGWFYEFRDWHTYFLFLRDRCIEMPC